MIAGGSMSRLIYLVEFYFKKVEDFLKNLKLKYLCKNIPLAVLYIV